MLGSRALKLFRVLIPSWRFFDAPGIEPYLKHRVGPRAESLGKWIETLPRSKRRPWNLFLNSKNNLITAYYGLVLQFLDDLETVNPVSYELVTRMVREFSQEENCLQWKLVANDEDLFISDIEEGQSK